MNRWRQRLLMWGACSTLALGAGAGEIHEAVGKGDVPKVTSLLKSNPSLVNARGDDYRQFPPLMIAVEARRTNMVELLLKHGADINGTNKDDETALFRASMWGRADMVRLLLLHKADVNAGAKSGRSPALEVAAINAHKEAVEVLLAHGARVDAGYVAYIQKMASDPILEKPENAEKKKAFNAVIELLSKSVSESSSTSPAPATARTTTEQKVTFTLAKSTVTVGESPRVTFSEPLVPASGEQYWITLVLKTDPDSAWGTWQYASQGAKNATLTAPTSPGDYEVRLHGSYPTKSYHVVHRASLTVVAATR